MKARLHLYPHTGPGTRGYIVGEPAALRSLARHLEDAARGLAGFDTVECYGSDGHAYELALVCDVSEEEWQTLPLPSDKQSDPARLAVVRTFDELKQQHQDK
jgi:hypothetical protein